MSAIIECKNLTHYYGQRKIYENLSFEVPQGRILGLLGKNGTGKTTTWISSIQLSRHWKVPRIW